jgi:hypothetical protein
MCPDEVINFRPFINIVSVHFNSNPGIEVFLEDIFGRIFRAV